MTLALARAARWSFIAAGVVGYPVLAYYSAATSAGKATPSLGVAVSLAPLLGLLLWLAWHSPRRSVWLLIGVGAGVLLWVFWGLLEHHFSWVYFIQHAGTNALLATLFGRTLGWRRQPLCTRFAEVLRGPLSPEIVCYTRQVTLAWTLFFVAMTLLSTVLFLLASINVWSIFADFLWSPLILLMFGAEYLVRLRKLPHLQHHSIMEGILAFWRAPKEPGVLPPAP
jgi:uncharacterized membrane protein